MYEQLTTLILNNGFAVWVSYYSLTTLNKSIQRNTTVLDKIEKKI